MGRHLMLRHATQKLHCLSSWRIQRLSDLLIPATCTSGKFLIPDRKGLCRSRYYSSQPENEKTLMKHLQSRIKTTGPLTVATYMKEVLTNSLSGYYMNKDVFGSEGDFTTSPEISQMFGEMLGVWVVNEWMNTCNDEPIQLVELGPGRGTLADDILRVLSQFPQMKDKVSLHLVEVSPTLGGMQAAKLTGEEASVAVDDGSGRYRKAKSKYGIDVSWYTSLSDVPRGLSCFLAHEFHDALPIHKFQKTSKGWCEVLVDVDPDKEDALRLVLSPGETSASAGLLKISSNDKREHIEVCPGAGITVQEICRRIKSDGGMALLADYGHTGEKGDTFRAFKKHQLHDPLVEPGHADLTADVDFSYLKSCIDNRVATFGPITQEKFLVNMGIGFRLQALLRSTKQEDWVSLVSGFKMLTSPEQMGERFKFLALLGNTPEDSYMPAGFVDLNVAMENENNKETSS